jgi:hypothetical protein
MRITLNTLTAITKVVVVVCNNRWGLHNGIYIRYMILVGSHEDALWLDSPDEATILGILKGCASDVKQESLKAPCPFCLSKDVYPELQ